MKQYYCQSCLWDKHETMGCARMQLRWEIENMLANMPLVNKAFGKSGYSMCVFFEQVELDEEGD